MAQEIHEIAGISIRALQGTPLSHFSVSERLSWTKNRKTKREEDKAYSLLGIFDVSMSPIYGERRERAFARLQKEIRESLKSEVLMLPKDLATNDSSESKSSSSSNIFDTLATGFKAFLGPKAQILLERFNTYDNMIDSLRYKCKQAGNGHIVTHLKVSDIVKWIDTPDYMQEFKKAQKTRLTDTGAYMLEDPTYKRWKLARPPNHGNLSDGMSLEIPQILTMKGKPGFGKTVLSSVLIEDLQEIDEGTTISSSDHGSTFFYHFASERRNCCEPHHTFRAVLAQLVRRYWPHQDILDRIAILMDLDNVDVPKASNEEVLAALSLLLVGLDRTVLVFDGIDECEEHTTFLEYIRDLCATTSVRVMLLGRPNMDLPPRFEHESLYLRDANLRDIKHFLEPQILHWKDRKLIPDKTSPELIVDQLVSRSEGIFLWARLISQYLNRKALSPKERIQAIFNITEFEGLHGIYRKILEILEQGYEKETTNVRKIFGLVAVTFRPLLVAELQTAIAISPGQVTEATSFIADFEDSLPIICGALVEVQSDRTVRFVHSSFRDFLASGSSRQSNFSLNERTAHIRCSTLCLSYLLHDLPASALCSNAEHLEPTFTFIRYSLQWVDHAVNGFKISDVVRDPLQADTQDEFYAILAKFINTPLTIFTWIEAARTFRMKPSLKPLVALRSSQNSQSIFASPFNSGRLAITLLDELAVDLERLDEGWGYLLRKDPSAIWGLSISAFCKSAFWVETNATTVTSMLPTDAAGTFRSGSRQRPILVQSQTSCSGDEIGIVLVLPLETAFEISAATSKRHMPFLSDEERQKLVKFSSSGWKVRYQRRNVGNEELLMGFEVGLPESQVCHMLQQCINSKTPHRFPFPVAFSPNLDRLIVLRSVLTIRYISAPGSEERMHQCRLQSLDATVSAKSGINEGERTAFYSVFSPNSKSLAFIFGQLRPKAIDCRRVQVWTDAAVDEEWPVYQCKGEAMTSRFSWQGETACDQFAFHPNLPILVFTEWNTAAAWMFDDLGPKAKRTIFKGSLTSLGFSDDGKHHAKIWTHQNPAQPRGAVT
ncbi:hypothetical protein GQ44DRAFT_771942 [Phaeosphaeriaceae sp. PMI808]|nr:hypothetical protein GQ44DRAFT_771942 [Phaeosphaeriaceae sp. PMI808]